MTSQAIEPARAALVPGDPESSAIGLINLVLAGLPSGHSKRAYKRHLLDFWEWYAQQGSPGLSKAIVGAYAGHLMTTGKKASVINQALSAIRKLATEAADNGWIEQENARTIAKIKGVKGSTLPAGRSISSGELFALLAACGATVADVRDAAIIALLYATGMRRGELVGLDLADYDADPGELKILHAKGNKQRSAPIVNGAAAALADWLSIRGNWAGPLFCPVYRSGHIKQSRLTTQAVYHIARKRAQLAGIEKSMSPHDFRRTVIGDLLDRGADIVTVQKLVGHSKTETTARYDRRPDAAKRRAVGLLHVPYISKLTGE